MLTLKELPALMIKSYPDYVIETCFENKSRFVCSLRHKTAPQGAATGGVCYLVDKATSKIKPYHIMDPMVRFTKEDIARI